MLFLVVSLVLVGFGYGACPTGWEEHGSWCYLISRDNATMPDAMTICKLVGGTLALVNSDVEAFLYTTLQHKKYSAGGAFWIDGNDQVVEGTWVDSRGQPLTYTNWGKDNQPDNRFGTENCVNYRRDFGFNYTWTDNPCGDAHNYICQKSSFSGAGLVG